MTLADRWTAEGVALLREKGLGVKLSRCIYCGAVALAQSEPCKVEGELAVVFVSDGICADCASTVAKIEGEARPAW